MTTMRVILDDKTLDANRPTLAGALEAARKEVLKDARILIEAKWDNKIIPDDKLVNPSEEPIGDAEIRFVSADPIDLVSSSLLEAAAALADAEEQQPNVAHLLQIGRATEAFDELQGILISWDAAHRSVLHGTTLLGARPSELVVEVDDEKLQIGEQVDRLTVCLERFRDAMEVSDWIELADILEGDLLEETTRWRHILTALVGVLGEHWATKRGALGGYKPGTTSKAD